ncbi:MAG: tetratricopeptide repeat protein [bacterium]|nr:tetratricopeptide repeat protein [bacterium]
MITKNNKKEKKGVPLKKEKGRKGSEMPKQNVSKDLGSKNQAKVKGKIGKAKKVEEADILYNQGLELVSLGRYEEALDSFEKAIKLKSNFAEAWYHKSLVLGILERPTEAIKAFEKTMALKPELCDNEEPDKMMN